MLEIQQTDRSQWLLSSTRKLIILDNGLYSVKNDALLLTLDQSPLETAVLIQFCPQGTNSASRFSTSFSIAKSMTLMTITPPAR